MTELDLNLIRKYDRPGPRYTSYPTAPLFNEDTSVDALLATYAQTIASETPLSLYVHIPYCHKLCWYCGCNMKVSRKRDEMDAHLELIKREIDHIRPHLNPKRKARQIHFGGGTPNYLKAHQLIEIMDHLRKNFEFSEDAEISIEADPRHLNNEQIAAMKQAGFNRISMGVQDLNPKVQEAINRVQPYDMVSGLVTDLRNAGYQSVNMDLIYGLPFQTPETFAESVQKVIEMSPDRLALFNFAYVPSLRPHMKLIKPEDMPGPEQKIQILVETIEAFNKAGYTFIGMDHFAKPGDSLTKAFEENQLHRNFQGYTTMAGLEMVGFGMSAITMLDRLYVQNFSAIPAYEEAVNSGRYPTWRGYALTDDDCIRRDIINKLMCRFVIELDAIEEAIGQPFDEGFPEARAQLDGLTQDGLLTLQDRTYRVTDIGRLLLRNIAMVFDRYLKGMIENKKASFSRTV